MSKTTSRKDNKGRVLQKGESIRSNGTYMYRWTDMLGDRHSIYAPTLNELREKEFEIQQSEHNGLLYSKGNIPLYDAICGYITRHENLRDTTTQSYSSIARVVKKDSLSKVNIKDIKVSMAKDFCLRMSKRGYKKSYIQAMKRVLHAVMQEAFEADEIIKNPFVFRLNFLNDDDTVSRDELSPELQEELLTFIKNSKTYSHYYSLVNFMLATGLRAGEVCGITRADIDFKNRTIDVNKQVRRKEKGVLKICPLKTKASYRTVYMFGNAKQALEETIEDSSKCITIDGYTDFVFRTKSGRPYDASGLSHTIGRIAKAFAKYRGETTPMISAHVFRHSFSAYLYTLNLGVQTRMYFMGHTSEQMTLNTYTKVDIKKAVNFAQTAETRQNLQVVSDKIA